VIDVQLVVLAKVPVAGRVKTRLCPPLSFEQAAEVAAAALADTLATVEQVQVRRRVVALDGDPASHIPTGFDVLLQRGEGLDERLASAYDDVFAGCDLPVLLVGMDTPQMNGALLTYAARTLAAGSPVLGHAEDGGWWAIGLPAPDPDVFLGVPMSSDTTGRVQEARMRERGVAPVLLPVLRDIDAMADLLAAAASMPSASRLAAVVRELDAASMSAA
jgi:rSAM/selenodomain-associated transferase 1